jgi:hypothetical protein
MKSTSTCVTSNLSFPDQFSSIPTSSTVDDHCTSWASVATTVTVTEIRTIFSIISCHCVSQPCSTAVGLSCPHCAQLTDTHCKAVLTVGQSTPSAITVNDCVVELSAQLAHCDISAAKKHAAIIVPTVIPPLIAFYKPFQ